MKSERGGISLRGEDWLIVGLPVTGVVLVTLWAYSRWDNWFPGKEGLLDHTSTSIVEETTSPPLPVLPDIVEKVDTLELSTSTPTAKKDINIVDPSKCVFINQAEGHGDAYSAWMQLPGQPKKTSFCNIAGPDSNNDCSGVKAPGGLPELVHPGDALCLRGFSPILGKPSPESYSGSGIRP